MPSPQNRVDHTCQRIVVALVLLVPAPLAIPRAAIVRVLAQEVYVTARVAARAVAHRAMRGRGRTLVRDRGRALGHNIHQTQEGSRPTPYMRKTFSDLGSLTP